jgi:hypothetical protein
MQSQREGDYEQHRRYKLANAHYGYHSNPYEIEANAMADKYAHLVEVTP